MIELVGAQLRFAGSILFGWRFNGRALDRIIDAMLATRREFGAIGPDSAELRSGPVLDDETRQYMQLRRFGKQARRAARETPYYRELFAGAGLDPAKLTWEELQHIPLTPKE